jgi:hypothetical protein
MDGTVLKPSARIPWRSTRLSVRDLKDFIEAHHGTLAVEQQLLVEGLPAPLEDSSVLSEVLCRIDSGHEQGHGHGDGTPCPGIPVVHVMKEQFAVHVDAQPGGHCTFTLRMKFDSTIRDLGLGIEHEIGIPVCDQGLEIPGLEPTQEARFISSEDARLLSDFCRHGSTVKCADKRVHGTDNFFRSQRILRGPVVDCLAELFKKRWVVRYPQLNADDGSPKYTWSDSMMRVCIEGSELEQSVRLPGTLQTVARKDGSLSNMLEASESLAEWLDPGDSIMIAGFVYTVERVRVKELRSLSTVQHAVSLQHVVVLNIDFDGPDAGVFDEVWKMKRDIQPMKRRDGKPIDRYILDTISANDLSKIDLTTWVLLVVGSTHRLLPVHRQHEYDGAVASGTVTEEIEQSYQLHKINTIRNMLARSPGIQLPDEEFHKLCDTTKAFIRACAPPGKDQLRSLAGISALVESVSSKSEAGTVATTATATASSTATAAEPQRAAGSRTTGAMREGAGESAIHTA